MKKIVFLSLLVFFLFSPFAFPLLGESFYGLISNSSLFEAKGGTKSVNGISTISYTWTTKSNPTGTMTIGGQTSTVTQEPCTYSISPIYASFDPEGGIGTVYVSTQSGCPLTATSNVEWIIIGKIVQAGLM